MIYNDKFLWLHVPKCAGTKVERIFKQYLSGDETVRQDLISHKLLNEGSTKIFNWHDSILDRATASPGFRLDGRVVVSSFRRLPTWLISRYNYEVKRSPDLPHNPEFLLEGKFLERSGRLNHADAVINKYLPNPLLLYAKVRFLRVENFKDDFVGIFGDYMDLSGLDTNALEEKENESVTNFIPDQIRNEILHTDIAYKHCPKWRRMEKMAYK